MNLESLANELLLDAFELMTVSDILNGFLGLNRRFNSLVVSHVSARGLDFASVSKKTFDTVCRERLPSIIDRIHSLRLSNDDDTPQQIDLFLSFSWTLSQFVHLQSLSVSDLSSLPIMEKLMREYVQLPCLTDLKLTRCYFRCDEKMVLQISHSIWKLPKLLHCHLDVSFNDEDYSFLPAVISSSIEDLSIENVNYSYKELIHLFRSTPRLRRLCVKLRNSLDYYPYPYSVRSMVTLQLFDIGSYHIMSILLENTPNLCHLTIQTSFDYVDGQQWQRLIVNYLPKLRTFRMKMQFEIDSSNRKENRVNQILESFESRFWLDEHRWYVRCHWNPQFGQNKIILYTLPYVFGNFDSLTSVSLFHFKSTYPQDSRHMSFNHVHNLSYPSFLSKNFTPDYFYFPKIRHLSIRIPFEVRLWSLISNPKRLTSLEVFLSNDDDINQFQLKMLLNQAADLYSLSFRSWSMFAPEMPRMENRARSIRRLDFRGHDEYGCWRVFNEQQCDQLSRSSLTAHCETLAIEVEHRRSILQLIHSMDKLRALNVQCQDDKWIGEDDDIVSSENDQLVDWLRHHLSSDVTITRDIRSIYEIRLWIR